MRHYDYLIVGCGLTGAVITEQLIQRGKRILILEKRPHIGGNCYTESADGIIVHVYGPHIFHTSNKRVWDWVNRFAEFIPFVNRPKVIYKDQVYSFPINLMTLYQLWQVQTPAQARLKLNEVRESISNPGNLEEWVVSQVGRQIYDIFVKGYTTKQWGKPPSELPADIIKRIPIRLNFDDNYYDDTYQGIPKNGYTSMIQQIIKGAEVLLETDYLLHSEKFSSTADRIIYTGMIDEFYGYRFGELEYRGLRFETETLDGDYQGNAVMNYTEEQIPYTRIIEHKFFDYHHQSQTIVTREYPQAYIKGEIAYYPVNDKKNNALYEQYKKLADQEKKVIFAGRLGTYSYLDMDDAIESALKTADAMK